MSRVKLTAAQYARLQGRPRAGRTKAPPPRSEAQLLRQVLGWLRAKGVFHWRANAGGGLRGGRPVRGNPEGTPDVLAVLSYVTDVIQRPGGGFVTEPDPPFLILGRLVAIEVKARGGRLRPAQRAWMGRAEAAGVLCLVVRSLDELVEAFALEGLT